MVPLTDTRLLVPVFESDTLRDTVAYAVQHALERAEEAEETASIHFAYPVSERLTSRTEMTQFDTPRELLDRVVVWATEDAGDSADVVDIETALVGTREYLFGPGDYADVLVRYARNNDIGHVVFDPGFSPFRSSRLLPTLENEVRRSGLAVTEASVTRERRNPLLVRSSNVTQFLGLFAVSFLFYLLLAGSVVPFELVTGAISATIVAVALFGISLTTPIRPVETVKQFVRFVLYVPYLLWEIAKANLSIAYVVLHPSLPIDPEMVEFDAAVWSALPVTTLANSITLTPGTLTVDVSRSHFTVHTLTQSSRADLFDGSLERAVRFVFYGRTLARMPSPLERREEQEDAES